MVSDQTYHLWLLRHAKAEHDRKYEDFDRPLTDQGKKDIKRMGDFMLHNHWRPDFILCSTAKRARQTLKRLRLHWEDRREIPTLFSDDLYLGDKETILEQIAIVSPDYHRLLVIGHNPGLEHLLNHWNTEEDYCLLPTATLARLECDQAWSNLTQGQCFNCQMTRPKDLPL